MTAAVQYDIGLVAMELAEQCAHAKQHAKGRQSGIGSEAANEQTPSNIDMVPRCYWHRELGHQKRGGRHVRVNQEPTD